MKRSLLILLLLSWNSFNSFAQVFHQHERCAVHHSQDVHTFQTWLQAKQSKGDFSINNENKVHQIPIVIHVLHLGEAIGEGTNLSDEVIMSQLEVINEDFRRKVGTRGFNDHPDGGDAKIEFVLAQFDPEGKPTNGIMRVDVTTKELPTGLSNLLLLSAFYSQWNPDDYLNIWSFPWLSPNTSLGVARFPVSDLPGLPEENQDGWTLPGGNEVDGVAVNAHHFGKTDTEGPYILGRTLTHELGHFFGLYHTWGPNDHDIDGCELDDFCEDTPPTRERTSGCPTNLLACDGRPAMVENYMDYADDACMNIFTQDQIARMRTVLENSPRRKSLLHSPALDPVLDIPGDFPPSVSVYPNPVADRLTISIENQTFEMVQIQLHDTNGRKVLDKSLSFVYKSQIELILPPTQERILFLTINTGRQHHRQKLIMK